MTLTVYLKKKRIKFERLGYCDSNFTYIPNSYPFEVVDRGSET